MLQLLPQVGMTGALTCQPTAGWTDEAWPNAMGEVRKLQERLMPPRGAAVSRQKFDTAAGWSWLA